MHQQHDAGDRDQQPDDPPGPAQPLDLLTRCHDGHYTPELPRNVICGQNASHNDHTIGIEHEGCRRVSGSPPEK